MSMCCLLAQRPKHTSARSSLQGREAGSRGVGADVWGQRCELTVSFLLSSVSELSVWMSRCLLVMRGGGCTSIGEVEV